jgi:hypothetical protein
MGRILDGLFWVVAFVIAIGLLFTGMIAISAIPTAIIYWAWNYGIDAFISVPHVPFVAIWSITFAVVYINFVYNNIKKRKKGLSKNK